jgi:hypothetical protein
MQCRVSGSHGSEYADESFLEYSAVFSQWSGPTFQRCVLYPSSLLIHRPVDGGSTHLWNVGLLQRDYTALYPRRLSSSCCIQVLLLEYETESAEIWIKMAYVPNVRTVQIIAPIYLRNKCNSVAKWIVLYGLFKGVNYSTTPASSV